jgi:hypothetical protein
MAVDAAPAVHRVKNGSAQQRKTKQTDSDERAIPLAHRHADRENRESWYSHKQTATSISIQLLSCGHSAPRMTCLILQTCAGFVDGMGAGLFAVCTIGFCLIRQSSASPIVCFHQSTRFLRLHRRAKALGLVVPWINERRGEAPFRRFSWPVTPHWSHHLPSGDQM